MKTQFCRMLVIATAVVVMAPVCAEANLLSWLSRLSGPGPFWGVDVSVCTAKVVHPDDRQEPVTTSALENERLLETARFPCPGVTLEQRHLSWNVNFGAAYAWKNPLNYGPGVDAPNVWNLKLGTSFDYTATPSLDIGAGVGIFHFGGKQFDNFTRPYVEPVRVLVRPLLWREGRTDEQRRRDAWLGVSVTWIIHLGTMDGADFGAPGDPFRSHNEHNWQAGISIDVLRLFKK